MKSFSNFVDLLIGNLIVVILVAALSILVIMYNNLTSTVQHLSKVMIQDRLELTKQELSIVFEPINQELATIREQGKKGMFSNIQDQISLNKIFIPLLKNSHSVSSLMIATESGDEYMLLKSDTSWITRITHKGSENEIPQNFYWKENPYGPDELLGKKKHPVKYDPRTRPWFKLALDNHDENIINWTLPYTFFTTKQPGITASTKWEDKTNGETFVIGLDILIADLSEFTTTIDVTENGKIMILSNQQDVIGLPRDDRFNNAEVRNKYALKKVKDLNIPVLNAAIKENKERDDQERNFSFLFEERTWWVGMEQFSLSDKNSLYIIVVVPETDFSTEIETTRHLLIGGFVMISLFFLIIIYSYLQMKKANKIIAIEKDKNERLLLNTLPIKVVNDLKVNGKSDPQKFRDVTVCFSDIVGFTQASAKLDPRQLINELNDIYSAFDEIMINYDCERIKTIGDAYLAVCGMPQKNENHAEMMLRASLEILQYTQQRNLKSQLQWQMRIGLHSGNVVGGIVGVKKYIYDVFGDTINTASRMESNSLPNRVNISEETYELLKDSAYIRDNNIAFEKRSPIQVKGKGMMKMYFIQPQPTNP